MNMNFGIVVDEIQTPKSVKNIGSYFKNLYTSSVHAAPIIIIRSNRDMDKETLLGKLVDLCLIMLL